MFFACLTMDNPTMSLSMILQCVLTLSSLGKFFEVFFHFEIFPYIVLSHPMYSCFMVSLNKIPSSYCMMPLFNSLCIIMTAYSMETSVSFISSIHQMKLPISYFLILHSLGWLQCRWCLQFSWGFWFNGSYTSSSHSYQLFIVFTNGQKLLTCFAEHF